MSRPLMEGGDSASVTGATHAPTGDTAVDEALHQLEAATGEPLEVQIEVSERVLKVLQSRLADLGQE
jgi:hypothetical protein